MWRDQPKGGGASIQEINQRILADATVSGTNLIVLVMAIMIACVGLNMNSVAVIIGAMLISPLMGGIVAIGYTIFHPAMMYLQVFAILTPSFIAAGLLDGRASGTHLSHHLGCHRRPVRRHCGGRWQYASGEEQCHPRRGHRNRSDAAALHSRIRAGIRPLPLLPRRDVPLFHQRLLHRTRGLPRLQSPRRPIASISGASSRVALGILITAPSIYLAYQMVEENLRDMQVKSFISEDMDFQTTSVVSYTVKDHVLTVDLVGTLLTEKEIDALQDELHARNRLQDLELVVIQGQRELDREQVQNLINARLEKQSASEKEVSYKNLSAQYYPAYKRASADQQTIELLTQQGPLLFPEVLSIQGGTLTSVTPQKDQPKTEKKVDHKRFMVEVIVKEPLRPEEADRLQKWIAAQVEMPVLMTVQTADHPSDFYGDGIAWP